jgi:hypothetical protein
MKITEQTRYFNIIFLLVAVFCTKRQEEEKTVTSGFFNLANREENL